MWLVAIDCLGLLLGNESGCLLWCLGLLLGNVPADTVLSANAVGCWNMALCGWLL